MEILLVFYTFFALIFITFVARKHFHIKKKTLHNLPPSPTSTYPIFGHLHLINKGLKHVTFRSLSKQYGPIMHLRLGSCPTVVVSSASVAEEIFTKYDVVFANRPDFLAIKHLNYNFTTLGFSPFGEHWRNIRRVSNMHIFCPNSLQLSSVVRTEEVRKVCSKLIGDNNDTTWEKVNLTYLFKKLVFDVTMKLVAGKEWSISEDSFRVPPLMNICDFIPLLKWIGYGGIEKNIIRMGDKRDKVLQDLLDESRRVAGKSSLIDKEKRTMVQTFLALQETEPDFYTDDIIKGIMQGMFTAGTDTTSLTMQWAMTLLLNHPQVMEKARNEINTHVASTIPPQEEGTGTGTGNIRGRLLEETDLPKLPYLRCIINETLRLFPPAALLLPHRSSAPCTVSGYDIPAGTTLIVNAYAIQRDPEVWEDPLKFKPERFEGIEAGNEGFGFLPFGRGRRSCPGSTMSMRFIGLTIGTMIQCFEWKRIGDEMVAMEENMGGITIQRDRPLEALYKPNHAYACLFN